MCFKSSSIYRGTSQLASFDLVWFSEAARGSRSSRGGRSISDNLVGEDGDGKDDNNVEAEAAISGKDVAYVMECVLIS